MSSFSNQHSSHKRGRWIAVTILLTLFIGLWGTGQEPVSESSATAAANVYEPTERQRRVSKLVSAVFERSHYRQSPINDPVSSLVLDRYLEALDPSRSYFQAGDIKEFERIRYQLDDAVVSGKLEPVFTVYNRFQMRNIERLNHAIELLKTEPDFALDESFEYGRSKASWPASPAEQNEIWRKRIKNDALSLMLTGKKWTETRDLLAKRYERALKRSEQITSDDVFDVFMNSFAHVFDPHSSYFSPRSSEEYRIQMSLSYEGIGASLNLVDDYVTIQNTLAGGSAAASGQINANDRIIAVGEGKEGKLVDVVGWRLDDVVQLIRGKEGTTVRLQILPAGNAPGSPTKLIPLMRSKITMENQAAKKEVRKIKRGDRELQIGIITVPSFYQDYDARAAGDKNYRSTTRDVRKLIEELKASDVDTIVMDLRGNGGGHLTEATGLTGLFIPAGPVVQLRETGGQFEVLDDPEPATAWDGPLTVLVDRFSASASEIFAAAIQDYGRGIIIGQQTYGKGTVQNLYPLDRYAVGKDPGFGQLTITIGKFYRVTGESTQHRGVQPDILLPSPISAEEVGESAQESALPWDRIRSVTFKSEPIAKQAVDTLETEHTQRIASDAGYKLLLKDVDATEQLRKEKNVSLNLKARTQQREDLDKAKLARENEWRQASGLKPLQSLEQLNADDALDAALNEAVQIAADLDIWNANYMAKLNKPKNVATR